jgi:hypothetical protein
LIPVPAAKKLVDTKQKDDALRSWERIVFAFSVLFAQRIGDT